jgi:hypothetical protein
MDTAVRVAGPRVSANDCAGLERLWRPPARLIGAEKTGFPAHGSP